LLGIGPMPYQGMSMTKEDLVEKITKILKTDADLDFLFKLAPRELEILVVCLSDLLDREQKSS
jgi:hypothetical protein